MPAPSAPYTPFYPSWQDGAGGATPIDAAALNHIEAGIEAALPAPSGANSGDVPIWNPAANGGAGGWDTSTNIKIAKSMLGALGIVDSDIAPGAAISPSKINGFPNAISSFLRGDGAWSGIGATLLWDSVAAGVSLPAATVATPSLDQTFKHLFIIWTARSSAAALAANIYARINGDSTAADYNSQFMRSSAAGQSDNEQLGAQGGIYLGDCAAANSAGSSGGLGVFWIPSYAATTNRKQLLGLFSTVEQASNATSGFLENGVVSGWWNTTLTAITTLTFLLNSGNFNSSADSRFSVYGVG